jgi:hypothetical protein
LRECNKELAELGADPIAQQRIRATPPKRARLERPPRRDDDDDGDDDPVVL